MSAKFERSTGAWSSVHVCDDTTTKIPICLYVQLVKLEQRGMTAIVLFPAYHATTQDLSTIPSYHPKRIFKQRKSPRSSSLYRCLSSDDAWPFLSPLYRADKAVSALEPRMS